jgi:PHD/YefM family antitoxin component YafN of YafNO toxin-antitoxin module
MVEARRRFTSLPDELSKHPEIGAIQVTRRGKPVLAVMSWDLYESVTETLEIMSDPEMMAAFRQGVKELKEGKTIPLEQLKKELGL